MLAHQVLGNLFLPLVAIGKKLLLVVQQFLVRLRGKLKVGTLYNGIHWTSFLTISAIDALGHVNIVSRGPAGSILAFLHLNGDGLSGTGCFAKLARNAPLLSSRVPTQSVFSAEPRTQVTSFVRVVDGDLGLHVHFARQPQSAPNLCNEKDLGRIVKNLAPWSLQARSNGRKTIKP